MRALSLLRFCCAAACILACNLAARADDCVAMGTAASIAQAKVPRADIHSTITPGKPPQRMEMIFLNDRAYVKLNGVWSSMPMTAKDQIDALVAAGKRSQKASIECQRSGGEVIGGEATSVLTMHEATGKAGESKVWLSNKTGLPMKMQMRFVDGTVLSDEFRYGNIQAPAGVK